MDERKHPLVVSSMSFVVYIWQTKRSKWSFMLEFQQRIHRHHCHCVSTTTATTYHRIHNTASHNHLGRTNGVIVPWTSFVAFSFPFVRRGIRSTSFVLHVVATWRETHHELNRRWENGVQVKQQPQHQTGDNNVRVTHGIKHQIKFGWQFSLAFTLRRVFWQQRVSRWVAEHRHHRIIIIRFFSSCKWRRTQKLTMKTLERKFGADKSFSGIHTRVWHTEIVVVARMRARKKWKPILTFE